MYGWYCNDPECKHSCFKQNLKKPKTRHTTEETAMSAADLHADMTGHGVAVYEVD